MADDERPLITSENLQEVLGKLDEVLAEAARLRKEVIRQLSDQHASQQQHLTSARTRKRPSRKR